MSNIIPFPKDNKRITKNPHEVADRLIELKLDTIEDIIHYMMPNLYISFNDCGIEVSDEKAEVLEAILRSIMHEHYNFEDSFDIFAAAFKSFSKHEAEVAQVAEERLQA